MGRPGRATNPGVAHRLLFLVLITCLGCSPAPAAPSPDAGVDGGLEFADGGGSRCTVTDAAVTCSHQVTALPVNGLTRDVFWQTPTSTPPAAGFPAVVIYQGSFFGPSATWTDVKSDTAFGGYHQARLQALLLDRGFVVIAPFAAAGLAWQTNSGLPWDATSDKPVIDGLLQAVRDGTFGPVDTTRLYATGISSGGYMTSRMAVSYPGVFRALAIQSGSYATCAGVACVLPATLPADHPPTRFLHGRGDLTVPLFTAEPYEMRLVTMGVSADLIIDDAAGHEWLKESPERILEWFTTH